MAWSAFFESNDDREGSSRHWEMECAIWGATVKRSRAQFGPRVGEVDRYLALYGSEGTDGNTIEIQFGTTPEALQQLKAAIAEIEESSS